MTISLTPSFSDLRPGEPIPPDILEYARERLKNRIHQMILREFLRQETLGRLSRKQLADSLNKRPEQITRWLGAPGNWTLDTVSDLLLGMGSEPELAVEAIANAFVGAKRRAAGGRRVRARGI